VFLNASELIVIVISNNLSFILVNLKKSHVEGILS